MKSRYGLDFGALREQYEQEHHTYTYRQARGGVAGPAAPGVVDAPAGRRAAPVLHGVLAHDRFDDGGPLAEAQAVGSIKVMFDDDDRITEIAELLEDANEALGVLRVEADARFVKYVGAPDQAAAEAGTQ